MMIEKFADLHVHSFYSDGTMSPEEIIKQALQYNVGLLAITDHDLLEGTKELLKICKEYKIDCISGVEFDSLCEGVDVHILGYGVDLKDEEFIAFSKKNREYLEDINWKLIAKMQHDFEEIDLEEYVAYQHDRTKGGWKTLHYLVEKGIADHIYEVMDFYEQYDCPYDCVDFPDISTVCRHIHSAGGVAILAHPGKTIPNHPPELFEKKLKEYIRNGIDGIECYCPSHTAQVTRICLELCNRKELFITAGSDCHGTFQESRIGEMEVTVSQLNLGSIM